MFQTPASPPKDPAASALLEISRRCARGGVPRSVLVLHLPAADNVQPYHARVARAILTGVAQRLEGEVLRLGDGDLALLCAERDSAPAAIGPHGAGPEGLPAVLDRLFATTVPSAGRLYSRWRLPTDAASLEAFLAHLPSPAAAAPAAAAPDPFGSITDLPDLDTADMALRRQTAMRLDVSLGARRLRPCFDDVTATPGSADGTAFPPAADPFVRRHFAGRLDQRLLAALAGQLSDHAEPWATLPAALHVSLTLPGILSDACATLSTLCRGRGSRLGVALTIAEAGAEPVLFDAARLRLKQIGAALILDGFTADSFATLRPAGLGASLIKLDWQPALARLAGVPRGRLIEALREAGPARVVLARAETEAALHWGLAQGIGIFQGRHVDAMLAAGRLTGCAFAPGCTLRQCIDRAAAAAPSGRAGCLNHTLLDGSALRGFALSV